MDNNHLSSPHVFSGDPVKKLKTQKMPPHKKIKHEYIISFIEQLALLLTANIPIITALDIIISDEKNIPLKILLEPCKNHLATGQSLYFTFKQYPLYFSDLICNLVNVGEQTGNLAQILNDIADHLTNLALQKRKTLKSLLYPMLVVSITILVTILLLLFVIPQFKAMYDNFGAPLPSYTQTTINLGAFIKTYWWLILANLVCIILYAKTTLTNSPNYLDQILHKLPVIKTILTYITIVRFTKNLHITFKAGISLLPAINITQSTIQNAYYRAAIQNVIAIISEGHPLHYALEKQHLFPPKMIQLIALGEATGTLDIMLEKIATIYSAELRHLLDKLNMLLEPTITLLLGIVVGGLVILMYLPIFNLGSIW